MEMGGRCYGEAKEGKQNGKREETRVKSRGGGAKSKMCEYVTWSKGKGGGEGEGEEEQ